MKLRTYQKEYLVVLVILIIPFFFTKEIRLTECIAVAAVFFTFHHAQIADRMQEKQAVMVTPDVECYWKSNIYFILKEMMWIAFFLMTQSWAALLGAVVFCCYPFWRKYYRRRNPLIKPPVTPQSV